MFIITIGLSSASFIETNPVRHSTATEVFLSLCSTWKDDRTAEEIAREMRKNRKSTTRFEEIL